MEPARLAVVLGVSEDVARDVDWTEMLRDVEPLPMPSSGVPSYLLLQDDPEAVF